LAASAQARPSRCQESAKSAGPAVPRRVGPRPSSNVCGRPQIPPTPAVDRRREVRLTAQLINSLFAHAEHLGDVDDSKELPPHHTPQYPSRGSARTLSCPQGWMLWMSV
jgi:hypothetical protein